MVIKRKGEHACYDESGAGCRGKRIGCWTGPQPGDMAGLGLRAFNLPLPLLQGPPGVCASEPLTCHYRYCKVPQVYVLQGL
ncbi:hypothetical protein ACOMHN_010058 [Nucella lapillus]